MSEPSAVLRYLLGFRPKRRARIEWRDEEQGDEVLHVVGTERAWSYGECWEWDDQQPGTFCRTERKP